MNQLNVSLQHSIVTLSDQGWSARKVARELGLNRETVGSLDWQELPEGQDCRIVDYLQDYDPRDRTDWERGFRWLKKRAEDFRTVFVTGHFKRDHPESKLWHQNHRAAEPQ